MTTRVDRDRILAYRAFVQGLQRDAATVEQLEVLDLGVQDSPVGSAAHALANRLPPGEPATSPSLATTWSVRGAPHVHRLGDLVGVSRALWPWSDTDALTRLDTSSAAVRSAGMPPREALRLVAEQIADIVTQPMAKGDVSTALTPRIPAAMTVDCRSCQTTHIVETLFRNAVLPAGITFAPERRAVTFVAVADWPGVPDQTEGAARLVAAYLRQLGPAGPSDVAAYLGTKAAEVQSHWPDGLVEVNVDGKRGWIPEQSVDVLETPPDPPAVRLLPPSDPLLQARDRALVVPDSSHRKALWPILGRPGALLVGGEVAGVWRARKKRRRLDVTVGAFGSLSASTWREIEQEAVLAATVRGLSEAAVMVQ